MLFVMLEEKENSGRFYNWDQMFSPDAFHVTSYNSLARSRHVITSTTKGPRHNIVPYYYVIGMQREQEIHSTQVKLLQKLLTAEWALIYIDSALNPKSCFLTL